LGEGSDERGSSKLAGGVLPFSLLLIFTLELSLLFSKVLLVNIKDSVPVSTLYPTNPPSSEDISKKFGSIKQAEVKAPLWKTEFLLTIMLSVILTDSKSLKNATVQTQGNELKKKKKTFPC
jgi:hypothetical protein